MKKLIATLVIGVALAVGMNTVFANDANTNVCPSVDMVKAIGFRFAFNENGRWSFGSQRFVFNDELWIVDFSTWLIQKIDPLDTAKAVALGAEKFKALPLSKTPTVKGSGDNLVCTYADDYDNTVIARHLVRF